MHDLVLIGENAGIHLIKICGCPHICEKENAAAESGDLPKGIQQPALC